MWLTTEVVGRLSDGGYDHNARAPRTLVELLQSRAALNADRTVYTFLGASSDNTVVLTYGELDRRARRLARQLQRSLRAGDRAIIAQRPGPNYITSFFGCLYAGVIAVPSYPPRPRRSTDHLHSIAKNCGAAAVITDKQLSVRQPPGEISDQLPWMIVGHQEFSGSEEWIPAIIEPDGIAFLQYTSGSTGDPKGVVVSHRNVMLNLKAATSRFGISSSSRGVSWLPPYHDMGLISGLLAPIYAAAEMVIMSPTHFAQRPIRWLAAITSTRATHSGGPNFAFDLCVSQTTEEERACLDLTSWDVAFLGAEPIRAETLRRFAAAFERCGFRRASFTPCYGMAEGTLLLTALGARCAPTIRNRSLLAHQRSTERQTTDTDQIVGCGSVIGDHEIVVVDPETGVPLPDEQEGEILIRGPCVAQSYWNRPAETRHTFHAELTPSNQKHYLRTGDLGFLSGRELFISGRIKDLMIIGGRNYHPHDIERTIDCCHCDLKVARSAAFSIDVRDEERAVALVETPVIRNREFVTICLRGSSGIHDNRITRLLSDIRRIVAQQHDLQLYDIALVSPGTIPRTSSGKIRRHACRLMYLEKLNCSALRARQPGVDC
jgi:acyl-CoA synthetase (AMP-forming)/AMP-acid ligase II